MVILGIGTILVTHILAIIAGIIIGKYKLK